MQYPHVVMQPASLGAIDKVCYHVQRIGVFQLRINNVGDRILTYVNLIPDFLAVKGRNKNDLTYHIIIYLNVHVLPLHRVFPNAVKP